MSSTNKTSLGLNMWEASDKPVRQDFVNDNVIVDEKISELNSNLSNYLVVTAWSNGVTYLPNEVRASYVTGEVPTGYEVLGCVGFYTSSVEVRIANIFKSSSNQIRFDLRNMTANSISLTLNAWVLLRKIG